VTYFFNGGRERPYPKEERILVPSLAGAHFDEHPEMSAAKVTETILANLGQYDFILANFANADMVGHTGNFEVTAKALEVLDFSIGRVMPKVLELDGVLIITSDHGNAEEKRYRFTGEKKTKHSPNPVPLFVVANEFKRENPRKQGRDFQKLFRSRRRSDGCRTHNPGTFKNFQTRRDDRHLASPEAFGGIKN